MLNTVLAAETYQIWRTHNGAYWDLKVGSVNKCSEYIKSIVRYRIQFCLPKKCNATDGRWLDSI